jgi:hypothetical protein
VSTPNLGPPESSLSSLCDSSTVFLLTAKNYALRDCRQVIFNCSLNPADGAEGVTTWRRAGSQSDVRDLYRLSDSLLKRVEQLRRSIRGVAGALHRNVV